MIGNKKLDRFFPTKKLKNVRIARKNSGKLAKKEAGTIMYACAHTHTLSYRSLYPFFFFEHANEYLDTCPSVLGANRISQTRFAAIISGLKPSVCLSPYSSAGGSVSKHWAPFGGAAGVPLCWLASTMFCSRRFTSCLRSTSSAASMIRFSSTPRSPTIRGKGKKQRENTDSGGARASRKTTGRLIARKCNRSLIFLQVVS